MISPYKKIIDTFFDHSKTVPASKIPFDSEVRKLCEQNMCGKYGTCWTCPPAAGSMETLRQRLEGFNGVIIFYKVYELEDSFDWEGMMNSVQDFQSDIFKAQKKIGKTDSRSDCLILGAGACLICDECTYPESKPCRFPEKAIYSVESFGIDAMKMMQDNDLKYNNGPNTVTYIGCLFYRGEA